RIAGLRGIGRTGSSLLVIAETESPRAARTVRREAARCPRRPTRKLATARIEPSLAMGAPARECSSRPESKITCASALPTAWQAGPECRRQDPHKERPSRFSVAFPAKGQMPPMEPEAAYFRD